MSSIAHRGRKGRFRGSSLLVVTCTCSLLVGLAASKPARAQERRDTVVVAGPQYAAGSLEETFFGDDYRDLWTAPIRVPLLDLGTFAGGLTPTARGGGLQTRSLRFRGADGREYSFRSVDKRPDLTNVPSLRGTIIADRIQDQTSSLHPTAGLIVPVLFEAALIPHVHPELFVMPNDPRLGEFREEFAGVLGQLEERPEDREDGGAGFQMHGISFGRIISTDRLLEHLEESSADRLDARKYLTARLMDLLIGDWDRHEDQWRWGETVRDGGRVWVPIPRDRDYAFVDYDGLAVEALARIVPNAVEFTPRIRNVAGLTLNARALDRMLLTELDRSTWDSVVVFIQSAISDEVIERAVIEAPEGHRGRSAEIAGRLRTRRDDLAAAALNYYLALNTEVDVRGTDQNDFATVDRTGEGRVRVRLFDVDSLTGARREYFNREFEDDETNEVRVYLHGGDDRLVVRGDVGKTVMVRVIGGGGDDVLVDSSVVRAEQTETAFYDGRGENVFVEGRATAVDDDEFEPPEPGRDPFGYTNRDWGASAGLSPTLGYESPHGVIIGGGPTYTRYGFWQQPYAYHLTATTRVGLASGEVAIDLAGDFRNTGSAGGYSFLLRGSELESIRFHGFGNETIADEDNSFYIVRQEQLLGQAAVHFGLPGSGRLGVGPILKYTRPEIPVGTPFEAENQDGGEFGQVGALIEATYDERDEAAWPTSGFRLAAGGSVYPKAWDAEPFQEAHATGSAYLTPLSEWDLTLALRAGGKKVWGRFPIHEAAFLGGTQTLRGYRGNRYAGDAMVFGNAELRAPLGTVKLLVRGDLGVIGLADAGRVFLTGESSDQWHTAMGGGLWFRITIRETTIGTSATYAYGERGRVSLKLGAPF